MPKFSIITINFNNLTGLQKSIESVISQTFNDWEYIIVDGGSTDGSVDEIMKHHYQITYWLSEPDTGIYNAMNKGIREAKGDYLFFLNSGDTFYKPQVLQNVMPHLKNNQLVYGNIMIKESEREWIKYYNEVLDFEYFTRDTLPHQGAFIKQSLFKQIGLYDETLKIVADWKFFLEVICIYRIPALYIDEVIVIYDYSGISSRSEYYSLQANEKNKVLNDLFPLHIESINELHELRKKKRFYDSFEKDYFIQKYFGAKLKLKALKRRFKK